MCKKTGKKFGIIKGKEYPVAQIKEHEILIIQDAVAIAVPVEYFT